MRRSRCSSCRRRSEPVARRRATRSPNSRSQNFLPGFFARASALLFLAFFTQAAWCVSSQDSCGSATAASVGGAVGAPVTRSAAASPPHGQAYVAPTPRRLAIFVQSATAREQGRRPSPGRRRRCHCGDAEALCVALRAPRAPPHAHPVLRQLRLQARRDGILAVLPAALPGYEGHGRGHASF